MFPHDLAWLQNLPNDMDGICSLLIELCWYCNHLCWLILIFIGISLAQILAQTWRG